MFVCVCVNIHVCMYVCARVSLCVLYQKMVPRYYSLLGLVEGIWPPVGDPVRLHHKTRLLSLLLLLLSLTSSRSLLPSSRGDREH